MIGGIMNSQRDGVINATTITGTTITATTGFVGPQITLGTSGILVGGTNTVSQYNGTSGQTFELYNTRTSASVYERLGAYWNSNVAHLVTEAAGGGSARSLIIGTAGAANLILRTNGSNRWEIHSTAGNLQAITDNAVDIGNSGGANRPRTIYTATSVVTPRAFITTSASPASNGTGTAGEITWDASFIYVCIATNTWERAALTGGY